LPAYNANVLAQATSAVNRADPRGRPMIHVGLLSFSDGRPQVHEALAPDIRQHQHDIIARLDASGEVAVAPGEDIVHSNASARDQAARLAALRLDACIFSVPVFPFPNYAVIAAQVLGRTPLLLLGPHDPRYPGLTGLLAVGGALDQIGVRHERLWLDMNDPAAVPRMLTFLRAAAAATRLRGQVYGLVGGRSIGMSTGAAPAERWQQQFGVDVDHVDEAEILRRAALVPAEDVRAAREWVERRVPPIAFDGIQLTPEKWDLEIRCHIALTQVVEESGFDFVGLKCHFEMSGFHCVQCMSAAFMNDPYDWRGPKAPVPLACEADSDGALTMQMLHLVSDRPACLLDVRFFDREKGVYVMPNCGSAPTWFAARSDDPDENLRHVRVVPAITKYAGGGAHIRFVFRPGELTLARLTRSPSGYRMFVARGEAIALDPDDVVGAGPGWPHAFVRLPIAPDDLVQTLQANHLHAVAGDYRGELLALCRLLDVEPVIVNPSAERG